MTRLARKLASGGFPVTLEVTPPRGARADILLRRARLLGDAADALNVIQRPERLSSLDASGLLLDAGLEPVWHVTNRGRSRGELAVELERARELGVGGVLVIRGEHAAADKSDTPRLRELVAWVCEVLPGALVGATLNPYGPRQRVLRNLAQKLDAGARYVQTQPVFEPRVLDPFVERLRARAGRTCIVAMLMPLLSLDDALRLRTRIGVPVPDALLARLDAGGEPAGWDAVGETVAALRACGGIDGLAVMTLQADAAPRVGLRLRALLEAAAD